MNQNGFISSSLLYGMLALFLVIMTSTLAILGNQKLGMDKLKENALNGIQYGYAKVENIYALYDGFQAPAKNRWKDQSGNNHDATLIDFPNDSYSNRHLTFNGTTSYLDTNISQEDLGDQISFSIVLNIKNTSGTKGLWGYYNTVDGTGIYAETNNKLINICYYTKDKERLCIDIGNEFFDNYVGKVTQLTVVMESKKGMEIYVNGISYDDIETTQEINPNPGNLIIGKSSANNNQLFQGDLYNFTIYNTALTYDDVMKNFEANRIRYNIIS